MAYHARSAFRTLIIELAFVESLSAHSFHELGSRLAMACVDRETDILMTKGGVHPANPAYGLALSFQHRATGHSLGHS